MRVGLVALSIVMLAGCSASYMRYRFYPLFGAPVPQEQAPCRCHDRDCRDKAPGTFMSRAMQTPRPTPSRTPRTPGGVLKLVGR